MSQTSNGSRHMRQARTTTLRFPVRPMVASVVRSGSHRFVYLCTWTGYNANRGSGAEVFLATDGLLELGFRCNVARYVKLELLESFRFRYELYEFELLGGRRDSSRSSGPTCSPTLQCRNGGYCAAYEGGATDSCRCPSGWTGPTCAQFECDPACLNGGTCVAANTCQCTIGWTGSICQTSSAFCTPVFKHGMLTCIIVVRAN
eukprot:SAG31_NODE_2577_length_5451_cov_3.176757_3_plen_203_part_00